MTRTRLKLSGIASVGEARLAVAAGADLIGLEAGATSDLAPDTTVATIALSLPPGVGAVILSRGMTAGTIAQQVDAAAAGAVQLLRPLDASEYPGLQRIIRGRKIIQCLPPGIGVAQARLHAGLADALELAAADGAVAGELAVPVFLAIPDEPAALAEAIRGFRPFGVGLALPRLPDGAVNEAALMALVAAIRAADAA